MSATVTPINANRPEYGSKYMANRDTAECAKLIRADIKAAQKAGKLPKGLKVSVRTSRFSGGSSVHMYISAAPFMVQEPEYLKHEITGPRVFFPGERYTDRARSVIKTLEAIGEAYRMDKSDISSDYFHCNFYFSVQVDHDVTKAEMDAARELYGTAG